MEAIELFAELPVTGIAIFFALAYAFTWFFHLWIRFRSISYESTKGRFLYFTGLLGPLISACIIAIAYFDAPGFGTLLLNATKMNFSILIYLFAIFLIPLVYVAARQIYLVTGGKAEDSVLKKAKVSFPELILTQIFVVNAEEFGWRGLAQPALQGHADLLVASLIVGVLWTFWHLPMFFVKDSNQYRQPILLYAFATISFALYAAVLYNAAGGSVLTAMLFHMSLNIAAFTIDVPKAAYKYVWIAFVILDLVAILLLLNPSSLGV